MFGPAGRPPCDTDEPSGQLATSVDPRMQAGAGGRECSPATPDTPEDEIRAAGHPACSAVWGLQATVTPTKVPSQRLFRALARGLGRCCEVWPRQHPSGLLPSGQHDVEGFFVVGPLMGWSPGAFQETSWESSAAGSPTSRPGLLTRAERMQQSG